MDTIGTATGRDDGGQGHGGQGGREPDGRRRGRLAGRARPGAARGGRRRRAQRGRRVRRRAQALVLHAHRPRRPDPRRPAARPAAAGPPARRHRAVGRRVRHRGHHRRAGQRARPGRGLERRLGPGTGPRPGHVLPAGVRRAGRRGAVGLAVRRPPRVAEQPRRRRRGPRRRPRASSAPTRRSPRCWARRRCGRWPGPRTWPASWSARSTRTRPPGRSCWTGRRRTSSAATGRSSPTATR